MLKRLHTAVGCWLTCCLSSLAVSGGEFTMQQTAATLSIADQDGPILVYNKTPPALPQDADPIYRTSGFLHPVNTSGGHAVTAAYPADHRHQNGIFNAWVKTTWKDREIDFWNIAGETGRVQHERVVRTFHDEDEIGFEVDRLHQAVVDPPTDILRERWKISVRRTDGTHRCFDLHTQQKALTDHDLTVQQYHYGGMAVRGPVRWILPKGRAPADTTAGSSAISKINNDHGSDRRAGNHEPAKWVTLSGPTPDGTASITVMSHPDNFRAPQMARLHPTKPYFCYAPCVTGAFVINRDQPFIGRYRFLLTDTQPDAKWLEEQWQQWTATGE